MVTRLDDLLLRRTKTAWTGKLSVEAIHELGAVAGERLGWTADLPEPGS